MLAKLLSLFLVTLFVFTSTEVKEINMLGSTKERSSSIITSNDTQRVTVNKTMSHDCTDCTDSENHDESDCCHHYCGCALSYYIRPLKNLSFTNLSLVLLYEWYSYTDYRSPLLDPALKPPLYS